MPAHWSSQIPKRYKRNSTKGDLHRAKKISSNFKEEINSLGIKYKSIFRVTVH